MSMQDPDLTPEETLLSRLLHSADPTAADPAATERRTQLFHTRRQLVRDEPGEAARIDHLLDRVLIEAPAAGTAQVRNQQAAAPGRAQRSVGVSPSDLAGTTNPVALLDPVSEPARPTNPVAPLDPPNELVSLVRPYALTGGRTRARYQLAIEALVSTTPRGRAGGFGLMPEHQRICDLCVEVKSLAEIAALMRMPLGVARVMVGDMAEAGLIAVHQSNTTEGKPDLALLERVLIGLRNL